MFFMMDESEVFMSMLIGMPSASILALFVLKVKFMMVVKAPTTGIWLAL